MDVEACILRDDRLCLCRVLDNREELRLSDHSGFLTAIPTPVHEREMQIATMTRTRLQANAR